MLRDIYDGEASFFEELPTRGPDAFFRFINLLKDRKNYASIAEDLCHLANPAYQLSDKYGYFYVLLNYDFEGIQTAVESKVLQDGFKLEFRALDLALSTVGYKSHKYKENLLADSFYSKLKKFSKMNFSDVSSCIVIILGFGVKNKDSKVIYGSDGKYIMLHDILNLFSDKNCPSLKYKPKIFLLPSFDMSQNDSVENAELLYNVNDTFLWYFPPLKNYKYVKEKFFGEVLSENLETNYLQSDFETIFKSSYSMFIDQLQKISLEDLNSTPEYERLGKCREKILFT
ncbi:Caspase-2 like protein [Argiope bruennichi]|uniref:Caspase-2 like protein n=2 Tax=Argiope bruennichi TaxID=94029 RepID=A0A8T0FMD5_ARGBR|nr:Caspase-2 like protein [Argiope bruennichi]